MWFSVLGQRNGRVHEVVSGACIEGDLHRLSDHATCKILGVKNAEPRRRILPCESSYIPICAARCLIGDMLHLNDGERKNLTVMPKYTS